VGPIEAVGTDSVTVAGNLFKVDTDTVIVRGRTSVSLASLTVGEMAGVKAAVSADGTWSPGSSASKPDEHWPG